jgi:hypothetical protein
VALAGLVTRLDVAGMFSWKAAEGHWDVDEKPTPPVTPLTPPPASPTTPSPTPTRSYWTDPDQVLQQSASARRAFLIIRLAVPTLLLAVIVFLVIQIALK